MMWLMVEHLELYAKMGATVVLLGATQVCLMRSQLIAERSPYGNS